MIKKTHFGINKGYNNPTPSWAINVLGLLLTLLPILHWVVQNDPAFTSLQAERFVLYIDAAALACAAFARFLGVTPVTNSENKRP